MLQFQTILHPTDFSERSEYAFRLACSLARDHDARLILLHVWSLPPAPIAAGGLVPVRPEDFSPEPFEEQLRQLHVPDPTIHVDHRLEQGSPATEIVRVAQETHCDLIVMGTHGRTGLERLLMGSVAEQVTRTAPCPVLTVKTPFASEVSAATPLPEEVARAWQVSPG